MSSIPHCPRCQSPKLTTRDYARKTGSAIGAAAGAASSAAAIMGGAETGATLGMTIGPAGSILGGGWPAPSWVPCSEVPPAVLQAPPLASSSTTTYSTPRMLRMRPYF
jgi:hypothetical protein